MRLLVDGGGSETTPGCGLSARTQWFCGSLNSAREFEWSRDRAAILWRRLDLPGHEAAELKRVDDGWQLAGVAAFVESARPCRLDYQISCDIEWHTQQCVLQGYVGAVPVRLNISRSPTGDWTRDGAPVTGLAGSDDIDLGFSPATNLLPIRRLKFKCGRSCRGARGLGEVSRAHHRSARADLYARSNRPIHV